MPELALGLFGLYFALAFGLRSIIQLRRTGSTGFKGVSGELGSVEWLAGVLFVAAIVLGVLAPVLDLAGALEPIGPLDGGAGHLAGAVLYAGGLGGTLAAQLAMGDSWRIGVDPTERTALVTTGPFAVVRNPIFSAMIPTSIGLALLVPNMVAVAGVAVLLVALEVQVRVVEEPYLKAVHGEAYERHAARTGRFVPGLGRRV